MKYSLIAASTAAGVVATAATGKDSPVEKVIKLLTDLKSGSEEELATTKETYNKMACFCKTNTDEKSQTIMDEQDKVDTEAGTIDAKQAAIGELNMEITQNTKDIAKTVQELADGLAKYTKEKTHLEAVIADLDKAVFSLNGAVDAVVNSKPAALMAMKTVVRKNLMVAEILGMASAKRAGEAFLQATEGVTEPKDYDFHSGGILETLKDLQTDFTERKTKEEGELEKTTNAWSGDGGLKPTLELKKTGFEDTKKTNEGLLATAQTDLGNAEEALEAAREALAGAQTFLKDLTTQCELKAREFDQNYSMRNGEITALSSALDIMQERIKVSGIEAERSAASLIASRTELKLATPVSHQRDVDEDDVGDLSFLQKLKLNVASQKTQRTERALEQLKVTASKLHSFELLNAAAVIRNAAKGPFDKVKKLIGKLIERLLQEAAAEATKKGWCDTETAKATKERDYRFTDIQDLNAELAENEATLATAESEIGRLTTELSESRTSMNETMTIRSDEKKQNLQVIKDSSDGLAAVSEALKILQDFYKGEHGVGGANSATLSLLQKESPIQEKLEAQGMAGTGEAAAYTGNQDAASGILGLLETIKSDFARSVSTTKAAEKEAAAAHVLFMRETKAFIAGAETEKKNNENTKSAMEGAIDIGMQDLQSSQGCMDASVKTLEDLQPACVDTGMSAEERKEKREAEVKALKNAFNQLCGDDCKDTKFTIEP